MFFISMDNNVFLILFHQSVKVTIAHCAYLTSDVEHTSWF